MNILVAVNNQYIRPLLVMLDSLFTHETEALDIYLFYSLVSERYLRLLDSYIDKRGGRFIPVLVEDSVFQEAPLKRYFTKEVYYRVLCGRLLPETLERILYLDTDIIIRGSLESFYYKEFRGKTLIGILDLIGVRYYKEQHYLRLEQIGLSRDDIYVNSGVLLFNLVKMRESFVPEEFLRQTQEKRDVIEMVDQDMINVYFKGQIGTAEETYNYPILVFSASFIWNWVMGGWRKENPRIVHYMGIPKPWEPNYFGKFYFEYRRYYKKLQSPRERVCFAWQHFWGYSMEILKGIGRVLLRKAKSRILK